MKRAASDIPAEVILISKIENLPDKTPGDKKDLDTLLESIEQGGLHHAIIVKPTKTGYILEAGKRRVYCVKKLGWKEIKAIVIDPKNGVPPAATMEIIRLIESFQHGELSGYEIARAANNLEEKHKVSGGDLARQLGLSQGYTYNLMRRWRNVPQQIRDAWKNHHPLLNQDQLEVYSHMPKEEVLLDWQKRLRLKGTSDPFVPGKKNGAKKLKPRRASERQIMKLLDAVDESYLIDPVKDLITSVLRFTLGIEKSVSGLTDYKKLPHIIISKEKEKNGSTATA